MKTKREEWLDHAKGIACFLVVLCHVLRGLINAGIIIRTSFLGKLDFIIYLFHMPLFFMVSGYFYKKNTEIKSVREYMIFVKKKIINLGVPYGIYSIIYIFSNMITSNTNQSLNWFNFININKIQVVYFSCFRIFSQTTCNFILNNIVVQF